MNTGENLQALRKIMDLTRLCSIILLGLHFYYFNYTIFENYGIHHSIVDRLLERLIATGLFDSFTHSKILALVLLGVSLMGVQGQKNLQSRYQTPIVMLSSGMLLYFGSRIMLFSPENIVVNAWAYMLLCSLGYGLILSGSVCLTKVIKLGNYGNDVFNRENETFPQEERLLTNEYSVNLPARYRLKGAYRKSWINIINPFRGVMVLGTPGSGKSYFVIRHIITQHLSKGFSMFVYDFKYDDLSRIAYNSYLKHQDKFEAPVKFYCINFDDLQYSHRCNPLQPLLMKDISDAAESARSILLGLNRQWIRRQGDFFVESPINFLTSIIWYLKKYQNGKYCTLPHVIELMQVPYDELFSILRCEDEIKVLINPFVNAYLNRAMEQLEGQMAAAKIAMARLSSPELYYVLSGDDFSLDINNPDDPKVVCMGNNPQKIQTYGAVLSLFINRMIKQVNQKGKLKSSLIFDEFPTVYIHQMDTLIATARSNKVATCLGAQDLSQLRKDYGREIADVLSDIVGTLISGQLQGESAKKLSERFGKILQHKESYSVGRGDPSINKSKNLELAIPSSRISTLSTGEFVGAVADDYDCKIELKNFHAEIQNDHKAIAVEQDAYAPIPKLRTMDSNEVNRTYKLVKEQVQDLVLQEMDRLLKDPALKHLVVVRN